eukprot:526666-Amphidinium_carterae.1
MPNLHDEVPVAKKTHPECFHRDVVYVQYGVIGINLGVQLLAVDVPKRYGQPELVPNQRYLGQSAQDAEVVL